MGVDRPGGRHTFAKPSRLRKPILTTLALAIAVCGCSRRPLAEDSNLTFQLPKTISKTEAGALSTGELRMVAIQITGPGMPALYQRYDSCEASAGCFPIQSLSASPTVSAISGANRLIQVLAVYATSQGSGTVHYQDRLVDLNPGENVVDMPLPAIETANVAASTVSGRYLTTANSGPTGELDVLYVPSTQKPEIRFARGELINGWFRLPMFPNLKLKYRLRDSQQEIFPNDSFATLAATPRSSAFKMSVPNHYLVGPSGRVGRNGYSALYGFFSADASLLAPPKQVRYASGGYNPALLTVPTSVLYASNSGTAVTNFNELLGAVNSYNVPGAQSTDEILFQNAFLDQGLQGAHWQGPFEFLPAGSPDTVSLRRNEGPVRFGVLNTGPVVALRLLPDISAVISDIDVFAGLSGGLQVKRGGIVNCSALSSLGFQKIATLQTSSADANRRMEYARSIAESAVAQAVESAYVFCPRDNAGRYRATAAVIERFSFLKENIAQLATSVSHSCYLNVVGEVKCWGGNSYGYLGTGDLISRWEPTKVALPEPALKIGATGLNTCALLQSGTVKCWGSNNSPIVSGAGTQMLPVTVMDQTPVPLSGVVDISVGWTHACALKSSGQVFCWGDNSYGQLGDGSTSSRSQAAAVTGLTNVAWIHAGDSSSCAVKTDGTGLCWGQNDSGKLGDGTITQRTSPVVVPGSWAKIRSHYTHACGIQTSGVMKCWGLNNGGKLGDGTTVDSTTPVTVMFDAGVTATDLSVSMLNTCAVTNQGVKCWGYQNTGELGYGHSPALSGNVSLPLSLPGLTGTDWTLTNGRGSPCVYKPGSKNYRCWGTGAIP